MKTLDDTIHNVGGSLSWKVAKLVKVEKASRENLQEQTDSCPDSGLQREDLAGKRKNTETKININTKTLGKWVKNPQQNYDRGNHSPPLKRSKIIVVKIHFITF